MKKYEDHDAVNDETRHRFQTYYESSIQAGEVDHTLPPLMDIWVGEVTTTVATGGTPPLKTPADARAVLYAVLHKTDKGPLGLKAVTYVADVVASKASERDIEAEKSAYGVQTLDELRRRGSKLVSDCLLVIHMGKGRTETFMNFFDTEDRIFTWGDLIRGEASHSPEFGEWSLETITRPFTYVELLGAVNDGMPNELAANITMSILMKKWMTTDAFLSGMEEKWPLLSDEAKAAAPTVIKKYMERFGG